MRSWGFHLNMVSWVPMRIGSFTGVKTSPSVSYSNEFRSGKDLKSFRSVMVLTLTSKGACAVLMIPLMTARAFSRRTSRGWSLRSSPLMRTASYTMNRFLPVFEVTSSPSSRVSLGILIFTVSIENARLTRTTRPSSVLKSRWRTPSVFSHTRYGCLLSSGKCRRSMEMGWGPGNREGSVDPQTCWTNNRTFVSADILYVN